MKKLSELLAEISGGDMALYKTSSKTIDCRLRDDRSRVNYCNDLLEFFK